MSTAHSLVSTPDTEAGHDHVHGDAHGHDQDRTHGPGRSPAARTVRRAAVPASLLRASLLQRLAVAIPIAVVLWVLTLWVIHGGAA